jgi:hypothetical protein
MTYQMDLREIGTVLAALRFWQNGGRHVDEIYDIASDGGTFTPLDAVEIDALCQRLNCGE